MKLRLAFASVLALSTAACASGTAVEALNAMQILENNPSDGISYASRSGSGGNLTLKYVTFKSAVPPALMIDDPLPPPGGEAPAAIIPPALAPTGKSEVVAQAETVTFTGLDMKAGKPVFTGMVVNGITPKPCRPVRREWKNDTPRARHGHAPLTRATHTGQKKRTSP